MSGIVQHNSITSDAQSVSITPDAPVSAGNALILLIVHTSTDPIESVSGATFTQRFTDTDAGFGVAIYDAPISESGSPEITVNFSTFENQHQLHLFESTYQEFDKANVSLQTASANPQGPFLGETTNPSELVLALFVAGFDSTPSMSAGAGYTAGEATIDDSTLAFSEFKELSSVGDPNATATASISSTTEWVMVIAAWYQGVVGGTSSGGDGKAAYYPRRARAHKPVRSFRRSGS